MFIIIFNFSFIFRFCFFFCLRNKKEFEKLEKENIFEKKEEPIKIVTDAGYNTGKNFCTIIEDKEVDAFVAMIYVLRDRKNEF